MLDLTRMIIYNVFLTSWTFAYESNAFLSWTRSYSSFKNPSSCWACGQLPVSNTSGLPWWISPLQGSNWMALRKFILEERNYSPVQGIPLPRQLITPALTLAIKNEFSSKVTQAQSEQQAKFQPRNKTSHNYGMDLFG